MPVYEIRYFKKVPAASLIVLPGCHSQGMAHDIAQYYLTPEFTRAEIWLDLDCIEVLVRQRFLH